MKKKFKNLSASLVDRATKNIYFVLKYLKVGLLALHNAVNK